jgi:hypothetical protein
MRKREARIILWNAILKSDLMVMLEKGSPMKHSRLSEGDFKNATTKFKDSKKKIQDVVKNFCGMLLSETVYISVKEMRR